MDRLRVLLRGIARASYRFPLTVVCLITATVLLMRQIARLAPIPDDLAKLLLTLALGAVLGMAAQFAVERYQAVAWRRLVVYLAAALAIAGYAASIWPLSAVSSAIGLRTFVATVAMLAAAVWVPAHRAAADFNRVVLAHLVAAFTAFLYGAVLSVGIASIIAAVSGLLVPLSSDSYTHAFILIWMLFAPVYYLSLLPRFHPSTEAAAALLREATACPRLLDILISYIAVPLIGVYTLVLYLYFLKMLFTFSWPVGQLGPLALWYEVAGLAVLVLAALPANRFAAVYRRQFPRVLVPIVIMQLISVAIRLNAYGITVSRYYVALIGLLSLIVGVTLAVRPNGRHSLIALLAAAFAVLSLAPPVDAFSITRASQLGRLEAILASAGILQDGRLVAQPDASADTRAETISILLYLDRTGLLEGIAWLPPGFAVHQDMLAAFGFETGSFERAMTTSLSASLDTKVPLAVSAFDFVAAVEAGRWQGDNTQIVDLPFAGDLYQLVITRTSAADVRVAVVNAAWDELVSLQPYALAERLQQTRPAGSTQRLTLPPADLTLDAEQDGYRLRVVLRDLYAFTDADGNPGADYTMLVFVGLPD